MSNRLHRSAHYQRIRPAVFASYGRTCHICGHDGATDADLLTPHKHAPHQQLSPASFRPAHGVRGCPTCGRKCNQERQARPLEDLFRPRMDW